MPAPTLSASELFRTLRDEHKPGSEKLQAAERAWTDANLRFPKQREFLLDWCLGRMLKAKDDQSPHALVASSRCWSFLTDLMRDMSSESLSGILTKIPTLPIFNAFLSRHAALATDEETCASARSVLEVILPLAAARATADTVSASLELVYEVLVKQTARCQAWMEILAGACHHLPAALTMSSAAVHKKILHQFLDQHLPLLMQLISTSAASLPSSLLEAVQIPLSDIAFDSTQLNKTLNQPSKQDVDFIAGWRKTPPQYRAAALPSLFETFVKRLKSFTPSFVASAASTSRSVTDSQSTLLIRQTAFAFLRDTDTEETAFTADNGYSLLRIIHDEHLYAPTPGHSEQWKATLNSLLSAVPSRVDAVCLVVQIEPTIADARIQELLASLDLRRSEVQPLFDLLRAYYTRARRLSDYLDALVQASPHGLPSVEKTPLASALALSTPPAQASALCSRLLKSALEEVKTPSVVTSPPPKKKQKTSSAGAKTSTKTSSVLDAACLVLEHVEPPFTDQQTLAQEVCDAFSSLHQGSDQGDSAMSMQLSVALVNWMLQHQSSMASHLTTLEESLKQAGLAAAQVLKSEESAPPAKYHAVLLAFALAAMEQANAIDSAMDFVLNLVPQADPSQKQESSPADLITQGSLSMDCWVILLSFAPSLSDAQQMDRLAEILISHFKSSADEGSLASLTAKFLRSSTFSQVPLLQNSFHAKLAKEIQSHPKLKRSLLRLPYGGLSSYLRKRALEACINPKKIPEADIVAFLAAHVQAGCSLPDGVTEQIAAKVQQAVRPKEDAFAQVLPTATKEAICQALELLSFAVQDGCSRGSLPSHYLKSLGSMLCQAPSSCNKQISESFGLSLRFLGSFAMSRHLDSQLLPAVATLDLTSFLASVIASQSRLLDHSDVAAILALLSHLLRPCEVKSLDVSSAGTQQVCANIISCLSTLVRHRKDIMVALFPALMDVLANLLKMLRPLPEGSKHLPLWSSSPATAENARLYGRLLTNITAKTVQQKSLASTRVVSSLQGPLSKHAGYFLLSYLRACTISNAPLSPSTRAELSAGLNEVVSCMNKYERDALMNGLLSARDEAERVMLRAMWKDYDRARYKGQA